MCDVLFSLNRPYSLDSTKTEGWGGGGGVVFVKQVIFSGRGEGIVRFSDSSSLFLSVFVHLFLIIYSVLQFCGRFLSNCSK